MLVINVQLSSLVDSVVVCSAKWLDDMKKQWNNPAVAQTGRCAHLFQLLLCSASDFISPSPRTRAVLRPGRPGDPSGPSHVQEAAVCGGRQGGEVVGLQRRGSSQDHPGSGAARQPPGQEVCLGGELQPARRGHDVGRGVHSIRDGWSGIWTTLCNTLSQYHWLYF